jgi:DNA-binding IclR family transcriptional regulator
VPAHTSALGKAVLSTLPGEELRRALGEEPLRAMTPRSITELGALERELADIRARGFSESREECIVGLHCLGAPVLDRSGAAVAGVSVSTPLFRMSPQRRREISAAVVAAALELSEAVPQAALAS